MLLRSPQTLLNTQIQIVLPQSLVDAYTLAKTRTCVNDFRIKKRFGKYLVRMLEVVDPNEPELLDCAAGLIGKSSSLGKPKGSDTREELAEGESSDGVCGSLAFPFCCFTHFM